VLGNYEITDTHGTDHEEAPCNANVVILGIITPDVVTPSVVLRSRRHYRASQ
jgi:hypothetical protein